jgi:hypothetical protein
MKKPCTLCLERNCPEEGCDKWAKWFIWRWEQIQEAAWLEIDGHWQRQQDRFTYEVPHLRRSPCFSCPCDAWCRKPCSGKRSWDRRTYAKR